MDFYGCRLWVVKTLANPAASIIESNMRLEMWCWPGSLPTLDKLNLQIHCLQQKAATGQTYGFDTKRSARAGSLPAIQQTSNKCRQSRLPSSGHTCPVCADWGISAKAISLSFSLCPHLSADVPTARRSSASTIPRQLIRHSPHAGRSPGVQLSSSRWGMDTLSDAGKANERLEIPDRWAQYQCL